MLNIRSLTIVVDFSRESDRIYLTGPVSFEQRYSGAETNCDSDIPSICESLILMRPDTKPRDCYLEGTA